MHGILFLVRKLTYRTAADPLDDASTHCTYCKKCNKKIFFQTGEAAPNHIEDAKNETKNNDDEDAVSSSHSSPDKKMNTETQLKRPAKKASPPSSHVASVDRECSDHSVANVSCLKQQPPLIQISNCKEDNSSFNRLQHQQSIELKPFKKKEVQISDSLDMDNYLNDERNLLARNSSLTPGYDSLSNSFNTSIRSDFSHLNTTTTTLATLSSTEDVNRNELSLHLTTVKNEDELFKKSVELMGQKPKLSLSDKSFTDSQNIYMKQTNSYLNSPSSSARVSLTPKFISIKYRLDAERCEIKGGLEKKANLLKKIFFLSFSFEYKTRKTVFCFVPVQR